MNSQNCKIGRTYGYCPLCGARNYVWRSVLGGDTVATYRCALCDHSHLVHHPGPGVK